MFLERSYQAVGVDELCQAADVRKGSFYHYFSSKSELAKAVIDLHAEGLDLPALLAGLREACPAMPTTVAFGSHVEAETLRAARQAGCDRVLPRSKFVEELEADLAKWLGQG